MSQNKFQSETGANDYAEIASPSNKKGFCFAKNRELRDKLPQALKESLGLVSRDLGQGLVEDRKFDPADIVATTLENINSIKVYSKSSAGCHSKILSGMLATAAYLGMGQDYQLHDNPLDIDGDAVQRTANGRGLFDADPRETFFKDIIVLKQCKLNTQKGGALNQGLHLLNGQVAPIEAHMGVVFEENPLSWLQLNAKITENNSPKNMKYLKAEMNNPVKLGNQVIVDIWAYRKLKACLYGTLSLTAMLLYPMFGFGAKSLKLFGQMESKVANLFGVVSGKLDEKASDREAKSIRKHVLAENRVLLLSGASFNKSTTFKEPTTSASLMNDTIKKRHRQNNLD